MADLVTRFRDVFGDSGPVRVVRAPGRANLIGEHTDYNGGFVMPMAIDRAVRIALVPHDQPVVAIRSVQFDEQAEFRPGEAEPAGVPHWLRYPMKAAEVLAEEGIVLRGFRAVVDGDVPVGSGLSSSSACTVASLLAFLVSARADVPAGLAAGLAEAHGLSTRRLAELGQKAEHRVGVLGGIMDQFVSLHGRAGHAILLDCRDLSYEAFPLPTDRAKVVIMDSAVPRRLTEGAYNERRRQCEEGVERLRAFDPAVRELRDVSWELFEAHQESLPEVIRRRCRHVITENARVLESAEALKAGDLARFGELLNASHDSLRDDYEVSRSELDLLVEIARGIEGVLGSRLTGAGFGGCTVTLARPEAVEPLRAAVLEHYPRQTGLAPRIWVSEAAAGAAVEQ
ncbi:MAG: galactokinase [Phycisphaerae bacterium]